MKKAFFALLLAFGGTLAVLAEVNPKPFVVPELTSWQGAEGRFVPSGRIVVSSNALPPTTPRCLAESSPS